MFTGISWSGYIVAVLTLLMVYYIYIGLKYYLPDLKQKHLAKSTDNSSEILIQDFSSEPNGSVEHYPPVSYGDEGSSELDTIDDLILNIRGIIEKSNLDSDEVNVSVELALILKKYPALKHSPLRPSLNELIFSEIEKLGIDAPASIEDIDVLWNNLP